MSTYTGDATIVDVVAFSAVDPNQGNNVPDTVYTVPSGQTAILSNINISLATSGGGDFSYQIGASSLTQSDSSIGTPVEIRVFQSNLIAGSGFPSGDNKFLGNIEGIRLDEGQTIRLDRMSITCTITLYNKP